MKVLQMTMCPFQWISLYIGCLLKKMWQRDILSYNLRFKFINPCGEEDKAGRVVLDVFILEWIFNIRLGMICQGMIGVQFPEFYFMDLGLDTIPYASFPYSRFPRCMKKNVNWRDDYNFFHSSLKISVEERQIIILKQMQIKVLKKENIRHKTDRRK